MWKAVVGVKVDFVAWCFPILLHVTMLGIMCLFTATLAMEGDVMSETAIRSKSILSAAAISLEQRRSARAVNAADADIQSTNVQVESARFAITQLQEYLTADQELNPVEILYLIRLDKGLVVTVVLAAFAQVTLLFENMDVGLV